MSKADVVLVCGLVLLWTGIGLQVATTIRIERAWRRFRGR